MGCGIGELTAAAATVQRIDADEGTANSPPPCARDGYCACNAGLAQPGEVIGAGGKVRNMVGCLGRPCISFFLLPSDRGGAE